MAKGTVTERSFDLLPEGWYIAKLIKVEEKQVGGYDKLGWRWEIIDGEYKTRWIFGDCFARLDQSDGCTWRRWQEALVERPISIDEDVDTDDVINTMAQVYVRHRSYEKDGETKWVAELADDVDSVQPMSVDDSQLPVYSPTEGSPQYQEGWTAPTPPVNDDPWAAPAPTTDEPPF